MRDQPEKQPQQPPDYTPPIVTPYKPELGQYINRPITGSTIEYSYDPWSITSGAQTEKFYQASLHPAVRPGLDNMINAIFWSGYHIAPVNNYRIYPEYEKYDNRVIELLEYQINRFRYQPFIDSVRTAVNDCLIQGFCVGEYTFRYDNDYICVEGLKTHSPQLFDLYTDAGYELDRIYYRNTGTWIERQTLDKFLVVTYPYIEHGKLYGRSLMQSIYFDVELIQILEETISEGTRRLSIRPLIHYYLNEELPEAERQRVAKILWSLGSGDIVSLPMNMAPVDSTKPTFKAQDIEVLEDRASPNGVNIILDWLNILYTRVNRVLGTPDDLGFSTTQTGSYAKSKEEMNLYTQNVVALQTFVEGMVTRKVFPIMLKWNLPFLFDLPLYKFPEFRLGTVEEEFDQMKVAMIGDLVQSGILDARYDMKYIREQLGLPVAAPEMLEDDVLDRSIEELPNDRLNRQIRRVLNGN